MSVIPVVFFGTADFALGALQALIHDEHYQIQAVISQPDRAAGRKMQLQASPVKQLAMQHGLAVFTPDSIRSAESLQYLAGLRAEVGVVVAYGQILSQEVIDSFDRGCVNIHASLLPRWRGAAPIQRALMAGDTETGVSLQKIVLALDAGDVLGTRKIALADSDDATHVYSRLRELSAELIHLELMDYLRGNLSGLAQNPNEITIARKLSKEDAWIDWSLPAREIFNRYRGMKIWPGSQTSLHAKTIKIHGMSLETGLAGRPGEIVKISDEALYVACGEQAIRINELQLENKAKMSVKAFVAGHVLSLGEFFGA